MSQVTSCALDCPDRCSILARAEAGGIHLRGNPENPHTGGFTCAKIRRYPARLTSPHRIREPWVRTGDHFRQASWEEALDTICTAIIRARQEDPRTILHVHGDGAKGATKAFVDYLFATLGARRTRGALCDAAGIDAIVADAGRLEMNDPREIDQAEVIVLWGKHPRASSIHTAAQVANARRRGVPVVAVNPDPAAVASLADRVICPRPGTDRFLALAVARGVLEADAGRAPWERAANPEAYRALLERHGMDGLLERCGVSRDEARVLSELYASTSKVATIVGWGIQRYPFGGENVRALHALAFVAGTLGVAGGGLYYSVLSARHLPKPLPVGDAPETLVLPALAAELARARPPVRFAWFTSSNLLNQAPDAKALREAFEGVETRVVVEGFWTETARHATVVLPAALWLEEEDLAGSCWHNAVGAVRRVADPPEECHSDFEIAREVATRLGLELPYATADAWLTACLPSGAPSLEEIRRRGWWQAPAPRIAWEHDFGHDDGKFRLLEAVSPEPPRDPQHPFLLLTLIRSGAMHSQMLPEEQTGALPVRLNAEVAARLGLAAGSPVRVASRQGELEGEVHLDPDLHPDAVACPRGGWLGLGRGVNEATEAALTDLGEGAAYYGTRVRVERVGARGSG